MYTYGWFKLMFGRNISIAKHNTKAIIFQLKIKNFKKRPI